MVVQNYNELRRWLLQSFALYIAFAIGSGVAADQARTEAINYPTQRPINYPDNGGSDENPGKAAGFQFGNENGEWSLAAQFNGIDSASPPRLQATVVLRNLSNKPQQFVGNSGAHPFEFFLLRPDGKTVFLDMPRVDRPVFRVEVSEVFARHDAVFTLHLRVLGGEYMAGNYALTAVALVGNAESLRGTEVRSSSSLFTLSEEEATSINAALKKTEPLVSAGTGLPFDPVVKGYHETHGLPESTKEQARAMGISIPGEQKVRSSHNPVPTTPGTPPQASLIKRENDSPPQSAAPLGFSPSSGIAILAALVLIAVIILWRASRRA